MSVTNKSFMPSVIMMNVNILSAIYAECHRKPFVPRVIMLNVVMLNVMAPLTSGFLSKLTNKKCLFLPDLRDCHQHGRGAGHRVYLPDHPGTDPTKLFSSSSTQE
jgi:hypothetical protein